MRRSSTKLSRKRSRTAAKKTPSPDASHLIPLTKEQDLYANASKPQQEQYLTELGLEDSVVHTPPPAATSIE